MVHAGAGAAVAVVESAYRLDLDDAAWLRAVTDAAEPLLRPGTGTVSYFFDLVGPKTAIALPYAKRAALKRPMQDMATFHDPVQRTILMRASPVSVLSKLLPRPIYDAWRATSGRDMGIVDSLGLCAVNPDGTGVVVSVGALERIALSPRRRALLARLSIHIGIAHRLRRGVMALASSDPTKHADAVLDAHGKVQHARGDLRQTEAAAWLRRAATAIDHARSRRGKREPEAALAAWKGLIDGRWSLVDHFDRDGRRYWIAHANAPRAPDPRRLTPAERRVVTYAAMGQSQKEIAYTLGVSLGTVGNHMRAGLDKLGLRSRVELVQFFSALWLRRAARRKP